MRFSTADLPEHERIPAWRDYWGRRVFGADAVPMTEAPFAADVDVRTLPGVRVLTTLTSPLRVVRTAASAADGSDCIGLVTCTGSIAASQAGHQVALDPGEATVLTTGGASILESRGTARFRCLLVDRALLPATCRLDPGARLRLSPRNPLLRLLVSYVDILLDDGAGEGPGDDARSEVLAGHVRDLMGLLLDRHGDPRAYARSTSAAHMARIKRFIAANACTPSLSIQDASRQLGLSVRYIQRLFAADDATFSSHLLGQRLEAARRALADPRNAGRKISDIALAVGFSDISYFNRCFRHRFGHTPGEARHR